MTHEEAQAVLLENRNTFLRVYATPKPGEEDWMEFRFPGLRHTGYLIETGSRVAAFLDYLNVTKIEVW